MGNVTAAYTRARRERARKQGYCGICVTRRAKPGHRSCQVCCDQREAYRARGKIKTARSLMDIPANLRWMADLL